MSTPQAKAWTQGQFLEWESRQTERFEYLDGMLVSMVGGTVRHQLIIGNIAHALRSRLAGSSRHVFSEGLKLRTPTTVTYPDVVVICDPLDLDADLLSDAHVVVEVLSPSTADFDLGRKWEGYRQLPSLRAYVVVWQDRKAIQLYERSNEGWKVATVSDASLSIDLPVERLNLSLEDVYAGTDA